MKDHAVYYAGPAKTPTGMASGSFGPTTAGRMVGRCRLVVSNPEVKAPFFSALETK